MKISDEFNAGSTSDAQATAQPSPGSDSESGRGERGADRSQSQAQGAQSNGASEASGGLTEILATFIQEITASAGGLIDVYADRARLSVRRAIVRIALGACVAVCASVWLGASSLAVLRGACGGLTVLWGGRAWMGDLTGGLLALILVTGAIALLVNQSTGRELARLRAKYQRIGDEHN